MADICGMDAGFEGWLIWKDSKDGRVLVMEVLYGDCTRTQTQFLGMKERNFCIWLAGSEPAMLFLGAPLSIKRKALFEIRQCFPGDPESLAGTC